VVREEVAAFHDDQAARPLHDQTPPTALDRAREEDLMAVVDLHRQAMRFHRLLPTPTASRPRKSGLRAWRSRDSFYSSAQVRAWLYRIATNVCLDMLRRTKFDVLRVEGRKIAEITTFGSGLFPAFGLPETL
jgi:hypothetical protein